MGKFNRKTNGANAVQRQLRNGLLASIGGTAILAGSAHAQSTQMAPPPPPVTSTSALKDVVVTATRQSTKLQKTPVAVTVFGAKELAQQNILTTRDLAGKMPGVTTQRAGITPLTQIYFIRGIGNSDPIFDPNVGQYLDDVYLPRAINGLGDLTDLERVEVLRGPQGTLFGANSDAGAIRYVSKDPTDQTVANFDVAGGNYTTFNTHAYIAGPIIPGKLDGSIAFAHDQHNGYTYDPTINQHVNDQDTDEARGKLLATINPDLTALLEVDGTRDFSGTGYYSPVDPIIGGTLKNPIYGPTNKNDSDASQYPINNSWDGGVSLRVVYNINPNLTFKSISAYRAFAQQPVNYNNDGQPLVEYNGSAASLSTPFPPLVSISDNFINYRDQEATQEFQLLGNYNRVNFVSGLYFLHENFASNRIGYIVSPTGAGTPAFPEDQLGDTKTTDYAAYAQANYNFTDKLIGTLGGRYTIENRGFLFQGIYDDFQGNPLVYNPAIAADPLAYTAGQISANKFASLDFTNAGELRNKTWYNFSPKYGISYQWTPDFYSYGSISNGFNAGGFNNRASSAATALPYDEETVRTYEIGLRTDWFEHRFRVNPTFFYNTYTNLQQTASVVSPITSQPVTVRTNAGSAHSDGFELETVAEPLDGLVLTNDVSYLNAVYDSFLSPGKNLDTGATTANGNTLPFSPRWTLYSQAVYTPPLDIQGIVSFGGDIAYTTSYYSDIFNYSQNRIGAQAYTDLFASYTLPGGHWTASVNGKNIFNRLQFQSLSWAGSYNSYEGQVSPPATVLFKLAYTY
jgi:iron complex outermembrane receptor protein